MENLVVACEDANGASQMLENLKIVHNTLMVISPEERTLLLECMEDVNLFQLVNQVAEIFGNRADEFIESLATAVAKEKERENSERGDSPTSVCTDDTEPCESPQVGMSPGSPQLQASEKDAMVETWSYYKKLGGEGSVRIVENGYNIVLGPLNRSGSGSPVCASCNKTLMPNKGKLIVATISGNPGNSYHYECAVVVAKTQTAGGSATHALNKKARLS